MGTRWQSRMNIKPLPKKVKVGLSGTEEKHRKVYKQKSGHKTYVGVSNITGSKITNL